LLAELQSDPKDVAGAFTRSFIKTDDQIEENKIQYSGTTVVSVLIREEEDGKKHLYSANVGDARAVLWYAYDTTRTHASTHALLSWPGVGAVEPPFCSVVFCPGASRVVLQLTLSLLVDTAAMERLCASRATTREQTRMRSLASSLPVALWLLAESMVRLFVLLENERERDEADV